MEPEIDSMDFEKAKSILKIKECNNHRIFDIAAYLSFEFGDKKAVLDGEFSVEELDAIVWLMMNMNGTRD